MNNVIYVLHPGWIRSRHDGDVHYVGAGQLALLYKIPSGLCTVYDISQPETFLGRKYINNLVHLYPQQDGEYNKV